ncbi:hypothetical protein GOBAR_DD10901 [Gossypium barbadense]|nr:hypothetical protein GOBAR_DD10901 [Gossypium barbadense]
MPYLKLAGFGDVALIQRLLGRSPSDGEQNFTCLTLAWLRANFKELSSTATEHEVMCAVRTYIVQLIGVIHLKCLPLLKDFSRADEPRLWELCINTPVLNFSTVEWYNGDQVMQQFGCRQFVSVEPQQFADVHGGLRCTPACLTSVPQLNTCNEQFISPRHGQYEFISPGHWRFEFISPNMGDSSSYHLAIGGLSLFHPEQQPISFDMFGNNMYSTPPKATFDPVADPPDVYSAPQRPPY